VALPFWMALDSQYLKIPAVNPCLQLQPAQFFAHGTGDSKVSIIE